MSNENMSGIPGVGAMTDTLDFVKKMWGGMNIPGMAMPSLSVNDINKQIADLKAVESWLTLNMNMLRGTIQALEVQSATISTLQSMGENMSAMMQRAPGGQASSPSASPSSFEPDFSFAPPTAEKPPAPKHEAAPEPQAAPKAGSNGATPDAAADAAAMAAQLANPAAWWNMLQDQFKQAVNTAVEPVPAAKIARAAAKPKTAAKSKAAPRKSKASKP